MLKKSRPSSRARPMRFGLRSSAAELILAAAAGVASAAPCTTATPECAEWIAMGEARAMVYRSHGLETKNEAITRAVVVVHGGTRDAHNNFRHLLAAAFLAGALDNTVIVSPRFASNYG